MSDDFIIRFRGVRGSHPMPGPSTIHFGGNTTCIEVRVGGHLIILDAGTGIIGLGNELLREQAAQSKSARQEPPIVAHLLMTHAHHDHTQGLPFFKPAYRANTQLHIFGPKTLENDLSDILTGTMLAPYFPIQLDELPAMKHIRALGNGSVVYLGGSQNGPTVGQAILDGAPDNDSEAVKISTLKSFGHPTPGTLLYRIAYRGRSLVLATDTEGYIGGDSRLIAFARGADLLIHDAQYTEAEYLAPVGSKQGWGHSTPEMAVNVAEHAEVKRLILFHHEPSHDDSCIDKMEAGARRLFPNTDAAYEGMEIRL